MKKLIITETQAKLLGLIKAPKNTLKITQEQYDRIFGSKIVTEGFDVKGGGTRVDTAFKKEGFKQFEGEIDITKPSVTNVFKQRQAGLPNNPAFGKVMEEVESQEDLSTEFVKFLYGKGELSELWTEDKIREAIAILSSKNLIIPTEDGNFKVSTSLGDPKTAMDAIRQELEAIKPQAEEMGQELMPMDSEQGLEEYDTISKNPTIYEVLYVNREIALLEKDNKKYYFNYRDSNYENAIESDYANSSLEIDKEAMQNFINNHIDELSVGFGMEDIIEDKDLVEIDESVKAYIARMYGNDKLLMSMLSNEMDNQSGLTEMAKSEEWGKVKNMLTKQVTQKPETKNTEETPEDKKARIMAILAKQREDSALNDKIAADKAEIEKAKYLDKEIDETMLGGPTGVMQSSGYNNAPVGSKTIKREIPTVAEKLNEMVAGQESTGEYTIPAFKMKKNHTDFADVTTKAEKTPQYAGGAFVEFNDCTKLNNKPAGSGCSAGAVDGVVKLKKASGSIISPSLAENKIYETIAAKTGKSIDEVKRIIKSKNGKA